MRSRARVIIQVPFIILLVVVCGCGSRTEHRGTAEEDIYEAAFRHLFQNNLSAQRERSGFYFLAVGDDARDPSPAFLRRFATHHPPVKPASQCIGDREQWVVDKQTGKRGISFWVSDIKWIDSNAIEVAAGYKEQTQSQGQDSFVIKKQKGKWIVTEIIRGLIASAFGGYARSR